MKKQNTINRLTFNKIAVTELNDFLLSEIHGGTSIIGGGDTCTGCCCLQVTQDLM
ncbi:MAG: class I lanthipeptide [Flavobacterium sp.]